MNSKAFSWALRIAALLVLTVATGAMADPRTPVHFRGMISDYSTATIATKLVGPWEMRGTWSLDLNGESGLADFSAVLNMELSDQAISEGIAQVDNPLTRVAHTHLITMTNATVSTDTSVCPADNPLSDPPTIGPGLVISGPVSVTANGSSAPFEAKGPSTLQVCITGGMEVQFSNVTLQFKGLAPSHFGLQPIHGVVRTVGKSDERDGDRH
jgi:hypothetical protein